MRSAFDDIDADARTRIIRVHETLKAAKAPRPRVAVIARGEPVVAAGDWVPEMVKRAGGTDVLAVANAPAVETTLDALRAADPEILLIAPTGHDLPRAAAEAERLLALDGWTFARKRQVFALDAVALLSQPSPRLIDGIEVMARLFNPQLFSPLDPAVARAI